MKSQRLSYVRNLPPKNNLIKIKNNQRKIGLNKKGVRALAKRVLEIKGIKQVELSILFASKHLIRKLNKRFRKIDLPTDVLAFGMHKQKKYKSQVSQSHSFQDSQKNGPVLEILGDLVICPEIAAGSAKIHHTSKEQEINLYLIHGLLHLLGYTDTSTRKRCLMEKEQDRILKKIASR